ncbi:MAG TPA: hypothetical protein VK536_02820 [Candidatus Limnocylindrales bacterium]|nr:hypothetical protein [Candidatus Limnocylindrales bacterium]
MQVICPQCGERGLLQKITPRYYRVRHSIVTEYPGRLNGVGKPYRVRTFTNCRVPTEWAEEQYKAEEEKYQEFLRELFARTYNVIH